MATFGTKLQGAAEASNLRQMAGDMGALSRMAPAQNRAVGGMDDGHYARNAKVEAEAPRVFSRWQMDLRHQDQMRQMQDEQNLQNWARLGIENRKFGHTKNMDTARLDFDKDKDGYSRRMRDKRFGLDQQRVWDAKEHQKTMAAAKGVPQGRKVSDFKDADAAFISKTLSNSGYDMSDIDPAALAGAARSIIGSNPNITPQQLAAETAKLIGATNMTNPDALLGVLNKGDVGPQKREMVLRALSGLGNGAVDENMTPMNIDRRMRQLEPVINTPLKNWVVGDPDYVDKAQREYAALQRLQSRNREKMKQTMLPEVQKLTSFLQHQNPQVRKEALAELQSLVADGIFTEDELGAIVNPSRDTGAYEGMGAGTAVPWIQ